MSEWQQALAQECPLKRDLPTIPAGLTDELDDWLFEDALLWLVPMAGADLSKAIRLLAETDDCRKTLEAHGIPSPGTTSDVLYQLLRQGVDESFLQIPPEFAPGEEDAALCRSHRLHLMEPCGNGRYRDRISGEDYAFQCAGTFAGGADDAATYGALAFRHLEAEEL